MSELCLIDREVDTGKMITSVLLGLRQHREWTQEELSARSGISVRTIRNLESGRIQNPRRSTVDLLLTVLDPDLREELQARAAETTGMATAFRAELFHSTNPPVARWRGPRPPRTSLVGRGQELDQLAGMVDTHPVTVLTGPGGVGKSRLALAVAEAAAPGFARGVAVAQLGLLPREEDDCDHTFTLALKTVTDLLDSDPKTSAQRILLVLDNTEHLPQTTTLLVEHLLRTWPGIHLIVTTRCPPVLAEAKIWEVVPLSIDAAVELLSQRLPSNSLALELADAPGQLAGLCHELDGLPRLIEFAAHRLRIAPLSALMSTCGSLELLWAPDFLALPHQRSIEASLRWSWNLLTERQQGFLSHLAGLPDLLPSDGDTVAGLVPDLPSGETVSLLADLADTSLLQVCRGDRYEYRMMRHVRTFIAALSQPTGEPRERAAFAPADEVEDEPGAETGIETGTEIETEQSVVEQAAHQQNGYAPAWRRPAHRTAATAHLHAPQPAAARETAVITRSSHTSQRPVS